MRKSHPSERKEKTTTITDAEKIEVLPERSVIPLWNTAKGRPYTNHIGIKNLEKNQSVIEIQDRKENLPPRILNLNLHPKKWTENLKTKDDIIKKKVHHHLDGNEGGVRHQNTKRKRSHLQKPNPININRIRKS